MIDASIPLQIQRPKLMNQADMLSLKDLSTRSQLNQVQLDQAQRSNQNQISLQDLFKSHPELIDQSSGMPTPEGMKGVYGIDPQMGMKLSHDTLGNNMLLSQIQGMGLQQKVNQKQLDEFSQKNLTSAHTNQTKAFVSAFDLVKKAGGSDDEANRAANQAWMTQYQQDKSSGLLASVPEEAQQQVVQRPRNIDDMRALVTDPKEVAAQREKEVDNARQMMTPLEKAQTKRAQLEASGQKNSREWKENQKLIDKETAPTTMMLYQEHPLPSGTASFIADQVLHGDPSGMTGMGRNPIAQAEIKAEVARLAKERGITGAQLAGINAEYFGSKSAERTLGNRSANIEMAVTEAKNVAPLALDASNKVDRTKYPDLNSILLAGQKKTGDPSVVQLGVATNSLINVYSRAIAPTGVATVSDKEHAREILSSAWSKGQYAAAVDMMMKEMDAARKSPGQVRGALRNAITGEADPSVDLESGAQVKKMPVQGGGGKQLQWTDADEKRLQELEAKHGK